MSAVRTINIERGMPTVQQAQTSLLAELIRAKAQGAKAAKIIHGYGSSGTGGRIRDAMPRFLAEQKRNRRLRMSVPGDRWSIFDTDSRAAMELCPDLRRDSDLGNANPGITIVVF